jgi:predicted glutamine amidotransferase
MCELLGLAFNKQIKPSFSFTGLLSGSQDNPEGWGIGYYPEQKTTAFIFKEAVTGVDSHLAQFLQSYQNLSSQIFIGHIRKSSHGVMNHSNTHPFERYFNRRQWLFAHNGTLYYPEHSKPRYYFPLGDTDSERSFCWLLTRFRDMQIKPMTRLSYIGFSDSDIRIIYQQLLYINEECAGSFNVLFSDGKCLFAFRDVHGQRPLYYLYREYPFATTVLRDTDIEVNLNLEKGRKEAGYIIASTPVSSEDWCEFLPGQLIVFKDGEIVDNLCL